MNSVFKQSFVSLGGAFLIIASVQLVIVVNQSIQLNDRKLDCCKVLDTHFNWNGTSQQKEISLACGQLNQKQ